MKKLNLILILILSIILFSCNTGNKQKTVSEETITNDNISQTVYPEWSKDAVLYEVNLRQYTPEGTLKAFEKHLPRLQQLGVKILWMMPMHPISKVERKGTLGSYYAVADYKAINPEFGTMDDFKSFVEKAHQMGFKVILDWVANHTGWDNQWIYDHPEWFTKDSLGNIIPPDPDWADIADLNFDVPEMRTAMIDAMKFWIKEADIDGYRCDVAWGVPVDFWEQARTALDKLKPIWMLAEDEEHSDFYKKAFNCNYSWSLHHKLNEIAQGETGAEAIKSYFDTTYIKLPEGAYTMEFTSNHDENSWSGSAIERMGDATKTMAALTFMLPGMPLIYSGQEASNTKRIEFFEKDEIDWSNLEMQKFYEKLVDLKQENVALWNGNAGGSIHFITMANKNNIIAFSRTKSENKIIGIFNLSKEKTTNAIVCKNIEGKYKDYFSGADIELTQNQNITLNPWDYMILISQ